VTFQIEKQLEYEKVLLGMSNSSMSCRLALQLNGVENVETFAKLDRLETSLENLEK
jgi:hypothetical protein